MDGEDVGDQGVELLPACRGQVGLWAQRTGEQEAECCVGGELACEDQPEQKVTDLGVGEVVAEPRRSL